MLDYTRLFPSYATTNASAQTSTIAAPDEISAYNPPKLELMAINIALYY